MRTITITIEAVDDRRAKVDIQVDKPKGVPNMQSINENLLVGHLTDWIDRFTENFGMKRFDEI